MTHLIIMKTILSRNLYLFLSHVLKTLHHSSRDGIYVPSPWSCVSICDCLINRIWSRGRDMTSKVRHTDSTGFFSLRIVISEPSHHAVRRPKPQAEATYRCSNWQHPVEILSNSQNQPLGMKVHGPSDYFSPQHSSNSPLMPSGTETS